jgi:hypothetical protein
MTILPRAASRLIGWMAAGGLLLLCVSLLLPVNPYFRFQQGDGTILFRVRWIYERIHFDSRPIEVGMIGSSRMEASVRAEELSQLLTAKLGRPIHVVNFGLPQEGRDLHWTIVEELLRNRSEVRLIVLSLGQESQLTHPGFRFLGTDASIASAPMIYNTHYVENLLSIPYRHIAYFVQGLWPRAFGISTKFDPETYRVRGFDPTESFFSGSTFVDRDRILDPRQAGVQREAVARLWGEGGFSGHLPLNQRFPIERSYVRHIAELAVEHGVTVAFLRVPVYGGNEILRDPGFYAAIGPIIEATQFGSDATDYMDSGHLNRRGTAKLAPWLADRLAPLLNGREQR